MKMAQISKISLALCSTAFALLASPSASAADPDIQGCWQGESIVQYFQDGRSKTQGGDCSFQVTADRISMRCAGRTGEAFVVYAYRITKPGTYTATMVSHSSRPDLVGGSRDHQYRIEGERLFMTTNPQTTVPAPPTAAVKVESVSVRTACK